MEEESRIGRLVERFPELGCFSAAVRRAAFDKDIAISQVIAASRLSASAFFKMVPGDTRKRGQIPSLASFLAIADGLGMKPEELLRAMRKEAENRASENRKER